MLAVRFAADWLAIWPEQKPVGLAVSGGPDSLGLLLLAQAAVPGTFMVATVDHGLRPESTNEARFIAGLCANLGIPHDILSIELSAGSAIQERARKARYAALGEWAARKGLAAIATAHHAEDQAETLLMRLSRGAGVRGLAAMRAISTLPGKPDCQLLRPLLGWRRGDLAEIVAASGIEPVQDPSNGDHRFERVRMRALLSGSEALDPLVIAASARYLAEADAAIDWAAANSFAKARAVGDVLHWAPEDVPRAVALRVLEQIVGRLVAANPRGNALARWHDRLAAGEVATLAGVRGDGRNAEWCFVVAPKRRTAAADPVGP